MEIGIVLKNKISSEIYFSNQDTDEILKTLLNNDPNNGLNIGYELNLNGDQLIITEITLPEILSEKVNGVNAFLIIYCEKTPN